MSTDIMEVTAEVAVARSAVWQLLTECGTYARLFTGIGACDPVAAIGGHPQWQLRIGTPDAEIHTLTAVLVVVVPGVTFELRCPALGSFAVVRLRDRDELTRITVTCFAPGRVHPAVAPLPNARIRAWLEEGLGRVAELAQGASTAVAANGERAALRQHAAVLRQIVASGVARTYRLDQAVLQLNSLSRWGFTLAGGYAAAAVVDPGRTAVVDDRGRRSFAEIHTRTQALAAAMADLGLTAGDAVGLLAHNHAGAVETLVAAGKLGVDVVLLNAGLSSRQLEDTVQRHRLTTLFVDRSLEHLVRYLSDGVRRYRTDPTPDTAAERTSIDDLIDLGHKDFRRSSRPGRLIVLTSGTSGVPKGARRPHPKGFATVAALLSRIPWSVHETMVIPAPLFHTWGLAAVQLSTALRATVVLPREFDARECLRLIAENRASTLVVVPTMVQRILDLPLAVRARYDTSSLRVVASCGAPLAGATVLRFMDTFGDVLYNVYGSTEVSWATVATPEDLRVSPTTAGRPPLGTKVAVLGPDRRPVPVGATGRIFVGNHMLFDGYVNYAPPDEADGLLDTGDLGYLDVNGRLFIAGRDDEMIISGGENVFPRPVEEALAHLPQITDVAVVGVPDREFGQRLAAFVVKREGSGLDSDMIRTYIRNRLSRFSVPRDVHFLDALPRGETGKVLKRMLGGQPAG
ncbi:AMP-binding protein [Nocardia sp. NPDC004068]|uniref:AMP-binding protein n=1 Tax=Nocardia sp. NPDC004068 TaxID=3364303 RepID=UPI0036867275